jgi:hypothetical protein
MIAGFSRFEWEAHNLVRIVEGLKHSCIAGGQGRQDDCRFAIRVGRDGGEAR